MNSISVVPPKMAKKGTALGEKRVALSTLGCKVNSFETELIAQKLSDRHYARVNPSEQADLYIINTCTVTAEADRQARQLVRKAIRTNPQAWIVVTGCYAEIDPAACSAIPGVDLVVGNSQKLDIPTLLDSLYQGELPPILEKDIDKEISLPDELLSGYEGRSRAFVQIQQGCDQGCTFCVIHKARGPNRSFSLSMIRRQVERLVINGYKEIVICGVDIGSYGSDFEDNSQNLTVLLKELVKIKGDYRLRLSSIDPAHISDELIDCIASQSVICPQLHLSMQSGNTLILKRMKRRATREVLYERVTALKKAVPDLVLSADILVGFPTESEEHFQQTLDAVVELEIAYPHVFSYSPRPGTPAAKIPSQIPKLVRKERAARVREVGKQVWNRVAERQIGDHSRILLESIKGKNVNGVQSGRASNYFSVRIDDGGNPNISFSDASAQHDDELGWVNVEITAVSDHALIARRVS
ncbi:MAG: tRNA (N(6)-L-threonylcarbamoyladenosine(37)-C(2))-methylthiotransferase MtaB [Gammaproteobacteria bacterium]|nr:tRNA (N(6)-L-threonylcarbamoyladenosine(37)-C(2))-methylthiotransferase MtaB [Gammaproteobacteria bacterium]